ncbi:MauE/DoxX family redox-associated membrane protein [Rathayibacter tanaceti]|uniref:Methylamine utilization protein MauE n=2 Tax=Rathayibacter tanaceti TaxID=1671680 RepID=A0A166H0X1_9MICO|nr:MauE/DoxX family redox-associated membrane protein [Rathayibacter tanaceti]KZX19734.1 Methylamine utilization protein MauE [Rathayibacter tanaceti]QHC56622.1 hypothetical protein GSU10_13950 [Rathayibacter tanaceti]TCO36237.1 methylamine utilization protein MauE [Rathayibacter tanaceti]
MSALALLPVIVGAAFLASGAAKIRGATALAEAAQRFGIPRALATPVTAGLFTAMELALGVAVLVAPSPWSVAAASAAALVLAGFVALTGRAWRRGDDFDCGCFGAGGSTRVGPGLVARNTALLAAAVGAVIGGVLGAPTPLDVLGDTEGRLWLAVAAVTAIAGLLVTRLTADDRVRAATAATPGQTVELPSQEHVIEPGGYRTAPSFEVVGPDGEVVESLMLVAHRPVLLVFVKTGCGSCEGLLSDSAELIETLGPDGPVLVFAVSSARSVFEDAHPELLDRAVYGVASAREKLNVQRTPGAVLIGLNSRLVAGPVLGDTPVRELAASARALLEAPVPSLP